MHVTSTATSITDAYTYRINKLIKNHNINIYPTSPTTLEDTFSMVESTRRPKYILKALDPLTHGILQNARDLTTAIVQCTPELIRISNLYKYILTRSIQAVSDLDTPNTPIELVPLYTTLLDSLTNTLTIPPPNAELAKLLYLRYSLDNKHTTILPNPSILKELQTYYVFKDVADSDIYL